MKKIAIIKGDLIISDNKKLHSFYLSGILYETEKQIDENNVELEIIINECSDSLYNVITNNYKKINYIKIPYEVMDKSITNYIKITSPWSLLIGEKGIKSIILKTFFKLEPSEISSEELLEIRNNRINEIIK